MNKRLLQIDSSVTISKVTSATKVIINAINYIVFKVGEILPSVNTIPSIKRKQMNKHEIVSKETIIPYIFTWLLIQLYLI